MVRVHGREVRLTPIEYDLLRALARNQGKLMTHQALLLEVWGPGYGGDTPSLRFHISNLRRKLARHGRFDEYVRTEQGIGYRFAPPTGDPGGAAGVPVVAAPSRPLTKSYDRTAVASHEPHGQLR
jgi:DNA-binding winged helix-turn-helix (wHTH) protein